VRSTVTSKTEHVDQLLELMSIGGGHAAGAFAGLVGRSFWMRVPRVVWCDPSAAPSSARDTTGVLFEVDGALRGVVALLLPENARDALVTRLVGRDAAEVPRELLESALRELGNIVVSHVCSAIADTLAARLVPSLPVLVLRDGEGALGAAAARRGNGRLRIETEIADDEGELHGRLVFVPDP
jgi:chemotaxis protein CheC